MTYLSKSVTIYELSENEKSDKNSLTSWKRKPMPLVNLDAMIPREDFGTDKTYPEVEKFPTIGVVQLLSKNKGNLYHLIHKPDFQRETSEWDSNKICDFIDCYTNGSFIPSIILWKSPSNLVFVIDGSHRLSALIAYLNDDYGDKGITKKFYNYNELPAEEIQMAHETRELIKKEIGSYDYLEPASKNPKNYTDREVERSSILEMRSLSIQWLPDSTDIKLAEKSFFKINQQGVALSTTEKDLCRARELPNCIATRAIMNSGVGNQYWKNFSKKNKEKLPELAIKINKLMFTPPYEYPVRTTLYLPIGGTIKAASLVVFNFINVVNELKAIPQKEEKLQTLKETTGDTTIKYMEKALGVLQIINSEKECSLGLLPALYFYALTGKHQPSSFLGIADLMNDFKKKDYFFKFTAIREKFENFLYKHKVFVVQIIRKYGSKTRSYKHLKDFYFTTIDLFVKGIPEKEIIKKLQTEFDCITPVEKEIIKTKKEHFSDTVLSAATIRDEIENALKCSICGARLYPLTKSPDHSLDNKFGGKGNIENHRHAHKYCNHGYKNKQQHLETKGILAGSQSTKAVTD